MISKNNFIFIVVIVMMVLSGCSFVVQDTRTPQERATAETTRSLLPTVTPDPDEVPVDEVGETEPEPTLQPPSLNIKGNISSSGEKIYHMPDGAYYDQVKIDESKGEMWFRSEEDAIAAGWRKSSR